ncbi:efflux RND transporter periplasmic adaptor subunit [Azospirillum sp. ST 5-10]|uniref:efflux RND transporter periplasmic adaptor subunit n=1 Tax=unclassified Azospirillum TaxID=2630922 RepID=UPI003F49C644
MIRARRAVPALCLAALLAACGEREAEAPPPVRPVLSMVVSPHAERTLSVAGVVEPRYRSSLGFRVLGRMIARDAQVGDGVRQGERLAAIDPLPFELAVLSAQADVSGAAAQLENTTAAEARQRTLLQEGTATPAEFEAAEQAREAAAAALTQARAALDKAREQLGYTQLRADFDGVVTAVGADVGQVVQPGQMVVTVARPDVREAVVDLPAEIAGRLPPGTRFEVALQLDPSVRAGGTVREVAPQADPATRTRRLWITLEVPPPAFRLGTTVTARLPANGTAGIEIPAAALLERDGRTRVWVVDPRSRTVALRDVRVAGRDDGVVRIAEGLDAGVRVVTAGVHSLDEGQTVKILDGDRR